MLAHPEEIGRVTVQTALTDLTKFATPNSQLPTANSQQMDLAFTIALCNLTIAVTILTLALWLRGCRSRLQAFTRWCDRCDRNWAAVSQLAPEAIDASQERIDAVRQLYRQQLQSIERLQSLRKLFGAAKAVTGKRRFRG